MANRSTGRNSLRAVDYHDLAEFRYQIRRFLRFSEDAARQAGLEPQHHQLMLAVKGSENTEPSIGYLAERLQLRHHSTVELVDRLVNRGLIQRSRGKEDRREVHVKLTSKGEHLLRELTLHHWSELRTAAPALVATLKKMMGTTRISAGTRTPPASGTAKRTRQQGSQRI